jgi:Zn-dependent protease with chaperone function
MHAMHGIVPVAVAAFALVVLPGTLAFLALWLMVRIVFRRAGVGGVLLTLGARVPNPQDDEEHRLVDVVAEMAVAAGIPPPPVVIIDATTAGGAANAAAVGWSAGDATVVVTRPLVDQLTRDQTQSIIARVIASIGNGDLKIAFLMLSIFEAAGLVRLALHGTSRSGARRTLWRFAKLAIRRGPLGAGTERSSEQQAVMDLLARGAESPPDRAASRWHFSPFGCLLSPVLLPIEWSGWTVACVIAASEYLVTAPLAGAMWRRRELLADATAVQLTRNPDGLAGALERLREIGVMVPRGGAVSYLFAAWWPGAGSVDPESAWSTVGLLTREMHVAPQRRLAQLVAMGAHPDPASRPDVTPAAASALQPPVAGLGQRLGHALRSGVLALVLVAAAGSMIAIALMLMSALLFVLGLVGLMLAKRHSAGAH